jgi:hypothetical protein
VAFLIAEPSVIVNGLFTVDRTALGHDLRRSSGTLLLWQFALFSAYSTCRGCSSVAQDMHTRTGSLLPNEGGIIILELEQAPQKMFPQYLQWCFRLMKVNFTLQDLHAMTEESATH